MPTSWWLVRGDDVLGAAEVANSYLARTKGLIGRSGIQGAMVLPHTRSVHTFFMKFPIDVAFVDRDMVVVATTTLRRWDFCLPRRRGRMIIEAEAGAFERWKLAVGDHLQLVETPPGQLEHTG